MCNRKALPVSLNVPSFYNDSEKATSTYSRRKLNLRREENIYNLQASDTNERREMLAWEAQKRKAENVRTYNSSQRSWENK